MPLAIQRSLAGGEIAPSAWARNDQAKVQTGLRLCRNFLVQRFGGAANRPGTVFVGEVDDSTAAHRFASFASSDDATYLLVFGDLTLQIVQRGALVQSGGSPLTITTPYAASEIRGLQLTQNGDRVTIACRGHAPYDLVRTADDAWTLAPTAFIPATDRPANCAATNGGAGATEYRYQVTAVDDASEESVAGLEPTKAITGATQANPCVLTVVGHGWSNGDEIHLDGIVGMTDLNGRTFTIANVTTDTVELVDEDATGYTAYASGGAAARTSLRFTGADLTTTSVWNTLTWDAVAGAVSYNIYKAVNGVFGYIGTSRETSFVDKNLSAATQYTPPGERNPFRVAGDFPAVCGYYQQRSAFASTANNPNRNWLSRIGMPGNFTRSDPIQDDDAVEFGLAGNRVAEVRHLREVRTLIMLTSTGAWTIQGDASGTLKPTAINPTLQEGIGAAATPAPALVGDSLVYVQARGSILRDLRFDLQSQGYHGNDLTLYAGHLFDGHTMVALDYAEVPHSILWAVRDDGMLLGLTYLRDQDVWGWHRHDTGDGDAIEDVAVVPEDTEDAVYLLARRTINGATKRYIERLASRHIADLVRDAIFVDSALQYDGTNTTATTLTVSGGTTWGYTESLTLTASADLFSAGEIGNAYRLRIIETTTVDGAPVTTTYTVDCTVLDYTDATHVTVQPNKTVPDALRAAATADWDRCVDEVAGLDHLEGRTVAILADGGTQTPQVVTSGKVSLSHVAAVVTVGLPITAQLQTLDLDDANGPTLIERRKRVNRGLFLVESSRGLWAGPDADHLREWKQRSTEVADAPPELTTGVIEVPISSIPTAGGSILVQQTDPLPLAVLAIGTGVELGGGA